MPFKSEKQARTMRAAAHDPAFAKKIGVPMKTAKKLVQHDQQAKGAKPKAKK
mgnify:CR=1 FL=1